MNPRNTWIWAVVAAGLFAFIFFVERHAGVPAGGPGKIIPDFQAAAVARIEVVPGNELAIRAERTNGSWRLTAPLSYPAQTFSIETLLAALERLVPARHIGPQELKNYPRMNEEFGFAAPQASIVIEQGDVQTRLYIGARTPPGNQVYLQVVGREGVYVVDADLLKRLPRNADDWRDTTLVSLDQVKFDRLVVTNTGKVLDLRRESASGLWRMASPNNARADNDRIVASLQRIRNLQVQQFVSDRATPDLESMGLQPPEVILGFKDGTNTMLVVDVGRSPTNNPELVYARRIDPNAIVLIARDAIDPWLASQSHDFRDFLDRHPVAVTAPPDIVEVRGAESFALQRQTNDVWRVMERDLPADPVLVKELLAQLTGLQGEIEKDSVTAPILPTYGLDRPVRQFVLRSTAAAAATPSAPPAAATSAPAPVVVTGAVPATVTGAVPATVTGAVPATVTGAVPATVTGAVPATVTAAVVAAVEGLAGVVMAQLDFGTNQEGRVFARNPAEDFIYAVKSADFEQVAKWTAAGWQLRDRRIWSFSEEEVVRMTVRQGGRVRELVRVGTGDWALAPGSQGIINDAAIEETVHLLGMLAAVEWVQPGGGDRAAYGFTAGSHRVSIELKKGDKLEVEFGNMMPSGSQYASVALEGPPWGV